MLNKTIFEILEEQSILKTTRTKPIVDAIKNRKKITFYYSGPRRPKKDSVKAGYRVKAEAVALGLSKKGNLVMRAFVQPPSTSKKGFAKHGWRTFILSRMSGTQITDEIFNEKRPGYKEGDDNGLSVTYVTTDWTKQPKIKKVKKPVPTSEPTKKEKPQITTPKPEVKPIKVKPEELPTTEPKSKPEQPISEPITKDSEQSKEIKPEELPQPKPEVKPSVNPEEKEDENDNNLQENIKRIKSLMLF